jgi:FRG domain
LVISMESVARRAGSDGVTYMASGDSLGKATYRASRAASFIDILSPVTGVFSRPSVLPYETLYRGVGESSYSLMPAAFRQNARLLQRPYWTRGPGKTNGLQISRELQTLIAFMNAADRQGHKIPEDTQALRSQIRALHKATNLTSDETIKDWPPISLLSILALAQHYGVPTRMLDWSLDPYVAAYFAAVSASAAEGGGGNLAVWAVPKVLFEVNEVMIGDRSIIERLPIQFVSTPWADNGNARAQRAVFLAYRQFNIEPKKDFELRSYDDLLLSSLYEGATEGPCLYCLTLPKSEAPELLRLLAVQGYDGATMFPGLDGAVKSLSEQFLWPEQRGPDPRSTEARNIFKGWINDTNLQGSSKDKDSCCKDKDSCC